MKFLDLQLDAFGPFSGHRLAFSPTGPGLHVVYGPNEAGKTSCMRAIDNLLYGIPANTTDNFLHENPKLRIGAHLVHSSGSELEVFRRKGRTNTLLDPENCPVDPGDFARFLGNISRDIYRALFSLTREEVERGNREILAAEGHLGEALFSAGLGGAGIGSAIERLSEEADALFRPRGSKQILNKARSDLESLRLRIAEAGLTPKRWEELRDAVTGGKQRLEALDRDLDRLRAETAECERACTAFDAARARRAAHQNIVDDNITDALVSQAAALDRLNREFSHYRKQRNAIPDLEAQLKNLTRAWIDQTRRFFPGRKLAPDDPLPLGREDELRIEELAEACESAARAHATQTSNIQAQQTRLESLKEEVAGQAVPDDITPLLSALSSANDAGDLDASIAKAAQQHADLEHRLETGLQSIGLWSGSANALAALPAPPPSTVERFERALSEAGDKATQAERESRRLVDERERRANAGAEGPAPDDMPSPDDLAKARGLRDALWRSVSQALESQTAPDDEALTFRFEESILETDHVADELLRHAQTVEQRVRDERELHALDGQLETARERETQARQELRELEEAWSAEWRPARIQPRPPREMHDWLRHRTQLLQNATDLTEIANTRSELARHRRKLCAQLAAAIGDAAPEDASLSELKSLGKTLAEAHTELETVRRMRAEEKTRIEEALAIARNGLANAESALEGAKAAWSEALPRYGFSADASPAAGRKLARELADLANMQRDLNATSSRLEDARKAVDAFESGIAKARKAAGYDEEFKHLSPADCFEAMDTRLKRARELRHEVEKADVRLRDAAPEGTDPESFAKDLLSSGREALDASLTDARRRLALAEDERESAFETFTLRRREFEELDGSAEAAHLEEERQSLLARMRSDAEHWATLTLARRLIQHAVEDYRRKNQGPVLARACEIFADLTGGGFRRIAAEIDASDAPVLAAVRDDGSSVMVDHLSEGTRDQLYLALRLAGLERYIATHEPLPLIVDDILITFDDERSEAVLRRLAELSEKTQVLLFTHHRHLVDLAKSVANVQLHTF